MDPAAIRSTLQFLRDRDLRRKCNCSAEYVSPVLACPECGATDESSWEVFGARSHGYNLNPCLQEEQIQGFERQWGVALPEEYRWFLINVGNGGAGPYYGLWPLGVVDDYNKKRTQTILNDLRKPFPHTGQWNEKTALDRAEDREAYKEFNRWYFSNDRVQGSIAISHQGCGYYEFLVFSGPERGNMWHDGRCSGRGFKPATSHSGGRLSFLEWYQRWLDESVQQMTADKTVH